MDRVKRCVGAGILLLITGCIVGVSTKSESDPQEEWQWKNEVRTEAELHVEADLQIEANLQIEQSHSQVRKDSRRKARYRL